MSKTIQEYVLQTYNECGEDNRLVTFSIGILDSKIRDIDKKIESLKKEIEKLEIERKKCIVDRNEYDDVVKANDITRMALRDFMKNRYDVII